MQTTYRIPTARQRAAFWARRHLLGNPSPMPPMEWAAAIVVFLLAPAVLLLAIVLHTFISP